MIWSERRYTHRIRELTASAAIRDEDQRSRIYNARLQLLIDGNYLNANQHKGAKIRLQFLGVRVKDPPAGPHNLGPQMSNMLVSREDQIEELQFHRNTRNARRWIEPCDGWVRPWAVRAVSGHSTHRDPAKNLLDIDPDKFAISPSVSLLNQLGGAFHATSCRNVFSIMENGILPGADVEDDYHRRHESGRVHSHYGGIFASWDPRNSTTKTRVAGRRNRHIPMVALCLMISFDKEGELRTAALYW